MKKSIFVVERLEGSWAILETREGDSFQFPKDLLPQPLTEGTHLAFSIEIDAAARQTAQSKMQTLRDNLKRS